MQRWPAGLRHSPAPLKALLWRLKVTKLIVTEYKDIVKPINSVVRCFVTRPMWPMGNEGFGILQSPRFPVGRPETRKAQLYI